MIKIITAMTSQKIIGRGKVLPWRIKEEWHDNSLEDDT